MEFKTVTEARKSARDYTDEPVGMEDARDIVETAGRGTPSPVRQAVAPAFWLLNLPVAVFPARWTNERAPRFQRDPWLW